MKLYIFELRNTIVLVIILVNFPFLRKSIKDKQKLEAGGGGRKRKRISKWKTFKMRIAMVSNGDNLTEIRWN